MVYQATLKYSEFLPIRHTNYELWLAKPDGSALFKRDATFIKSRDLKNHPPAVMIDEGTRLNPVSPEP